MRRLVGSALLLLALIVTAGCGGETPRYYVYPEVTEEVMASEGGVLLLEKETSGGFRAANVPYVTKLQLYSNGKVKEIKSDKSWRTFINIDPRIVGSLAAKLDKYSVTSTYLAKDSTAPVTCDGGDVKYTAYIRGQALTYSHFKDCDGLYLLETFFTGETQPNDGVQRIRLQEAHEIMKSLEVLATLR